MVYPLTLKAQMANWYYYNKNGEKIGPLSAMVLKEIASQGLITTETKVETEEGKIAPAGKVKGLTFAEAKQPEATVYGFEDGLNFPSLTSEGPTLTDFDPFANAAPITRQAQPPSASSKLPAVLKKPIVSIPLGCLGLFFVMFVIGGIVSTIIGPEEMERKREAREAKEVHVKDTTIKIPATFLMKAYVDNKVLADQKYKDKIIHVTGIIDAIGKDLMNTPYVSIQTKEKIFTVQCMFSKKNENTLTSLQKRYLITIQGKCSGATGNVILKDCIVIESGPQPLYYREPMFYFEGLD